MENCTACDGIDYHEIIECIVSALDAKDAYTAGHSQRVNDTALIVSDLMGLKEADNQNGVKDDTTAVKIYRDRSGMRYHQRSSNSTIFISTKFDECNQGY